MTRGFIDAKQARYNTTTNINIHREVTLIEAKILEVSNTGLQHLKVDFTPATSTDIEPALTTIVDALTNTFMVINHGFISGEIVVVASTDLLPEPLVAGKEYVVHVIDTDTFRLDGVVLETDGEGLLSTRKVIVSEQYYQAWKNFYNYPNADSFLTVLYAVESHFRGGGYFIKRYSDPITHTLFWEIKW